jgi:hypothetical protein
MFTTSEQAPLMILSISSLSITSSSAAIFWTTNNESNSRVEYGTTISYGSSTVLNSSMVTSHTQSLSNLAASTTYHYRVTSTDGTGIPVVSQDNTFTTAQSGSVAVDIISIVISDVTDKSATISWTTSRPADSKVEYWTVGSAIQTSALQAFVNQHSLVLQGLNKLTKYYFHIKSVDENGNQGISGDADFTTTDTVISALVMPRFSAGQNFLGEDTLGGLGITTLDGLPSSLGITAMDDSGNLTSDPNITNPATVTLNPWTQLPILDTQLFGTGISDSSSNGWISIESNAANTYGFFEIFDKALNFMDGASFGDRKLTDFAITDIQTDGYTKISLINNNPNDATVAFDLVGADGAIRDSQSRVISKRGAFTADLFSDLFSGTMPNASDYVQVKSSEGVQSFEFMRQNAGDAAALTGQDITTGSTILYSPQYAVGGYVRTTLSVINLDSIPAMVTFRFMNENGVQLGVTRSEPILPKGKLNIEDQAFFLTPDAQSVTAGYVEIRSSGARLTGSTIFGDIKRRSFITALALVSNLQTSLLFSQIASNDFYYTGLAFLNPNPIDTRIAIKVYDRDGSLIGSNNELLGAGQRISRTITQYVAGLVWRDQTSGYVIVTSEQPIASYALFGTNNLSIMSAIPPLAIPISGRN